MQLQGLVQGTSTDRGDAMQGAGDNVDRTGRLRIGRDQTERVQDQLLVC
jgi:hypothetical protein